MEERSTLIDIIYQLMPYAFYPYHEQSQLKKYQLSREFTHKDDDRQHKNVSRTYFRSEENQAELNTKLSLHPGQSCSAKGTGTELNFWDR